MLEIVEQQKISEKKKILFFFLFFTRSSHPFIFVVLFLFCATSVISSSGSSISSVIENNHSLIFNSLKDMLLDKLGGASQTRMICGAPAPSLPPTKTCFRVLSRVSLPLTSHLFRQPLPFTEMDQSTDQFNFVLMGLLP